MARKAAQWQVPTLRNVLNVLGHIDVPELETEIEEIKDWINYRPPTDQEYEEACFAVRIRSGGRCEANTPVCDGRYEHTHHKAGRRGPHPHRLDNLLAVCLMCHGYIHANPGESYRRGWMESRLEVPAAAPDDVKCRSASGTPEFCGYDECDDGTCGAERAQATEPPGEPDPW